MSRARTPSNNQVTFFEAQAIWVGRDPNAGCWQKLARWHHVTLSANPRPGLSSDCLQRGNSWKSTFQTRSRPTVRLHNPYICADYPTHKQELVHLSSALNGNDHLTRRIYQKDQIIPFARLYEWEFSGSKNEPNLPYESTGVPGVVSQHGARSSSAELCSIREEKSLLLMPTHLHRSLTVRAFSTI